MNSLNLETQTKFAAQMAKHSSYPIILCDTIIEFGMHVDVHSCIRYIAVLGILLWLMDTYLCDYLLY